MAAPRKGRPCSHRPATSSAMHLGNGIKARPARDVLAISKTARLTRGVAIAGIAQRASFDSLHIDLERNCLPPDTPGQARMACRRHPASPRAVRGVG